MTGEVLYKNVLAMITAYEEASGTKLMDKIIAHPEDWENETYTPFYASAAKLILEARRQMDKEITRTSVTSAAKRILKNANKLLSANPLCGGIFPYDEKFAITDGYRIARFNNDILQLPHIETDDKSRQEIAKLEKVMNDVKKEGETLHLPDIRTLKEFLAEKKSAVYCIDEYIWVNPQYLIDMLGALPGCIAYKPDRPIDPLYFKAENGDGLLLPVRCSKK